MGTHGTRPVASTVRTGALVLTAVFAFALGGSLNALHLAAAPLGTSARQADPPEAPDMPETPGEPDAPAPEEDGKDDMPEQPPMCPGVGCPAQRG